MSRSRRLGIVLTVVLGVSCFACSSKPPVGDSASVAEGELTPEQGEELDALDARLGESDPASDAGGAADAAAANRIAFGPAAARILRAVLADCVDAAGYGAASFFHEYRDAGEGQLAAWFDIGELSIARAEQPAPPLHRRGLAGDRVVVLDIGEMLHRLGADAEPRAYHGVTRARDRQLSHHYVDTQGRAITGVTERHDGVVQTRLLRHAD